MDFFAEYWLPDYPDHIIKRGKITISVSGEDHTAPILGRVQVTGDNTLQARIYDGGKIRYAKAVLRLEDDPGQYLAVDLNDNGLAGDRAAGDHIFSAQIPEQPFGLYTVEIETADEYGNTGIEKDPRVFVLH